MKLHIYIFRHGQTYYNKNHIFTGWKNSKLTQRGKKDAQKIAQKLKNKRIDVAYHTRLSRSIDTLKPVLKFHPECKQVIKDDRMIERSYGKLEGHRHSWFVESSGEHDYKTMLHWHKVDHLHGKERQDFIKKLGASDLQVIRRSYTKIPPGGESIRMVEKRVMSFIKDLLKKMKKEKVNVAISAHGNSMRPFRRYFEKLTIKEMMKLENPWDDYFEYTIEA
ncbi:MAG: histidine phosphatase family protein [Candidatus Woesearchaeota archaeon]